MNWFHDIKNLYDGTLNKTHHLFYSTDITKNETFKFREDMKQEGRLSFMESMENEIHEHKEGGHWNAIHCNTIPNKYCPIKSIRLFKRKRKPDGEILKHKSRLCAHGSIQQWGDSYWETYIQ